MFVQRIFFPVGQGAYYMERMKGDEGATKFISVYDCGALPYSNTVANKVKQTLRKGEQVDILFISHFDADHVNLIPTLKAHAQIKRVILPLLFKEDRAILYILYKAEGEEELARLVNNPRGFFGDDTVVTEIEPPPGGEPAALAPEFDAPKRSPLSIPSGTRITPDSQDGERLCWTYIPYNHHHTERFNHLRYLLEEKGIDVERLEKDKSYQLEVIKEKRADLRKIYNTLGGKINQNSMFLLSIPKTQVVKWAYRFSLFDCLYPFSSSNPILKDVTEPNDHNTCSAYEGGCLYTGDADLNMAHPENVFQHYWKQIGTVQIPHHGDIKAYFEGWGREMKACCVISYGLGNKYGHPSWTVIADIINNGNIPIEVTETHGFVEKIKLECEED